MTDTKEPRAVLINRTQAARIVWLLQGACQDKHRPLLNQTIHATEDALQSADGFMAKALKPSSEDIADLRIGVNGGFKIFRFGGLTTKSSAVGLFDVGANSAFPAFDRVYGDMKRKRPVMRVSISPDLFRKALPHGGIGNPMMFTFYGENSPIEITGKVRYKDKFFHAYSLVMPVHLGDHEEDQWYPYERPKKEKTTVEKALTFLSNSADALDDQAASIADATVRILTGSDEGYNKFKSDYERKHDKEWRSFGSDSDKDNQEK
jgi:hypothetical protein